MNYERISHDITKFLITSLYNFDHPITSEMKAMEINAREQRAFEAFCNDPIFHAKVRMLTAMLLGIIQHHEDIEKYGEKYTGQKRKFNEVVLAELLHKGLSKDPIAMKEFLNGF